MTRGVTMLLMLPVLLAGGVLQAEEWLGLNDNPQLLLLADISVADNGDLSGGINADAPIGAKAGFRVDYRHYELSDDVESFDSLDLATALWIELSELVDVEVGYFFEGNEEELEKETLGLALDFNRGNWNLRLQFEEGELLVFTRDGLGVVRDRLIPERLESDLSSNGVILDWQGDAWYWQLSHSRYDYEASLSNLGNNALTQFIVKSAALAQSSLLVSKRTSVVVGHADYFNDYAIQMSRDQSAIDDLHSNSLVMNWQHWLSSNIALNMAAIFPGESEFVGASLGLRWVM